jgi:hypothetical protein
VRVKPAISGTVIRDPHTTRALPDDGADVPPTSFWYRRLRDGDVIPAEEPPAPTGLEPVTPLTTRETPAKLDPEEKKR